MNKKIVLGLGLCLLLTVINLHRAMDNYGITDAKFKVGVLADESSSSGTSCGYDNLYGTCYYIFDGLLPYEDIIIFNKYYGQAESDGTLTISIFGGEIYCEPMGNQECQDSNCSIPRFGDIWSLTRSAVYEIVPE